MCGTDEGGHRATLLVDRPSSSKCNPINNAAYPPGGYFHIRRSGGGGLAPNFASDILAGAPNFASKNINDKYPKFCPLNFRYDPKIGTF